MPEKPIRVAFEENRRPSSLIPRVHTRNRQPDRKPPIRGRKEHPKNEKLSRPYSSRRRNVIRSVEGCREVCAWKRERAAVIRTVWRSRGAPPRTHEYDSGAPQLRRLASTAVPVPRDDRKNPGQATSGLHWDFSIPSCSINQVFSSPARIRCTWGLGWGSSSNERCVNEGCASTASKVISVRGK